MSHPRLLLGLFLLAFSVRFFFATVAFPAVADATGLCTSSDGYEDIAKNLLAGNGFRVKPEYAQTTLRMPIYPGFLAAVFAVVGERLWVIQMLQSCFGAATCAMIFLLMARWFDRRAAVAAALAWAFYPGDLVACARYLAEPLAVLFLMGSLYAYDRLTKKPVIGYAVLVALGMVLAAHTKSSTCFVPLVVVFALATTRFLWRRRLAVLRNSTVIGVVVFVASVPWAWRTHQLTGHWVYPSTLGGCCLMDGQYVTTHLNSGKSVALLLREARELQAALAVKHNIEFDPTDNEAWIFRTAVGEYEMDRLQKAEFRSIVFGDLKGYLTRFVKNIPRFWYLGRTTTASLISALIHAPMLLFAMLGVYRAGRARWEVLWFPALIIVHFNLLNALIDPLVRYSVTSIPFVCLFIGAAFAKRREATALGFSTEIDNADIPHARA